MWRAYKGVKYTVYLTKFLYWSILKKSRHLGFGVFIDIRSMIPVFWTCIALIADPDRS
jgi:hypothetical protein